MSKIEQYSAVRIKKFIDASIDRNGWKINQSQPKISDLGTVTDIITAPDLPNRYVVESTDAKTGATLWLSEFLLEELELTE